MRLSPAALSSLAYLPSRMPLVVSAMSSRTALNEFAITASVAGELTPFALHVAARTLADRLAFLHQGKFQFVGTFDEAAQGGHPVLKDYFRSMGFPCGTGLVQVVKDPLKTKGARLSMNVSIAGRYLVFAPTGSGKTLAAFMWAINRLVVDAEQGALDGQEMAIGWDESEELV